MSEVIAFRGGTPIASPGRPDPAVVADAEHLLEMARSGEVVGFAASCIHSDGAIGDVFSGVVGPSMIGSLFSLATRITMKIHGLCGYT